jgi:hypothetical protein
MRFGRRKENTDDLTQETVGRHTIRYHDPNLRQFLAERHGWDGQSNSSSVSVPVGPSVGRSEAREFDVSASGNQNSGSVGEAEPMGIDAGAQTATDSLDNDGISSVGSDDVSNPSDAVFGFELVNGRSVYCRNGVPYNSWGS